MRVLVDTNVLIDYSKGNPGLLEDVLKKCDVGICPVNIAEFLNDQWLKKEDDINAAKNFAGSFTCYDVNSEIGEMAGEFMRKNQTGYLGDALVAGVCLKNDLVIVTRNVKHFDKIKGLKFYGVEGKRKGES